MPTDAALGTGRVDPAMWPSPDERDAEAQVQKHGHLPCVARAEDTPTGLRVWFDVAEGFGFKSIEGNVYYVRPLQPRRADGRIL